MSKDLIPHIRIFYLLPTLKGWIVVFTGLLMTTVAMLNPNPVLALLSASVISIVFVSFIMSLLSLYKINIRRLPNEDTHVGLSAEMSIVITNLSKRSRQPFIISEKCLFTAGGRFDQVVSYLRPSERRIIKRFIPALKRGRYDFDKIVLQGGDPAGIFKRKRYFWIPTEIIIFPEIERISSLPLNRNNTIQSSGRASGMVGFGQEYFAIRRYIPGADTIKNIHWKASAKKGKLLVKEYESHKIPQISILLDTYKNAVGGEEPYNTNFEFLIKSAASIVDHLSCTYCNITYAQYSDKIDDIEIIEGTATETTDKIFAILSETQTSKEKFIELLNLVDKYIISDSILYCLTMTESTEMHDFFNFLLDRGVDIRWLYAEKKLFRKRYSSSGSKSLKIKTKLLSVEPKILCAETKLSQVMNWK
ncbi:MAG: DUF58 domain-containing protein [Verrucomicrobiota bacterium]|nr:DUF58 domain-containing protein [Verrucomicrobiota bacterium]